MKLEVNKWDRRLDGPYAANDVAAHDRALINTAIVDSGASGWYFKPGAPVSRVKQAAKKHVRPPTLLRGQLQCLHVFFSRLIYS